MARTGSMLGVIASAAMLAACSGSGEAAPETTLDVPPTVAATVPDPTTTNPPSTQAPTTTIDPATALAEEVEADFRETIRLTNEAFLDPTNEQKVMDALDGYIGANRAFIHDRVDEFRLNGWVTRANPSVDPDLVIEVPARLIPPSEDVVEMQVCEIDPWIVVEPGAGPNGEDAIVDDALSAYRSVFFLRFANGRWVAEGSEELGRWSGLEACPAS